MLVTRAMDVKDGDTVDAVRRFLAGMLVEGVVDRVFAPVELAPGQPPRSQVLADKPALTQVNPLAPVMVENEAVALRKAMALEPRATFAAVLRPCEVRMVIELAKRGQFDLNRLVIVGVDCLATHDASFYSEISASHPDDPYWLMHESLRFAQKGQITPYRFRAACQFCDRPAADYEAADVLLGIIGVDAHKMLLVLADELDDVRLRLEKITDRKATEREAVERELMVWTLAERRKEVADRKVDELGLTGGNMGAILGYLSRCTLCGKCVNACPLCAEELGKAKKLSRESFLAALVTQSKRLVSCSGCGMCETHCPEGVPLCAINRALSQPIREQMHYIPGRDFAEPLPWKK